MTGSTDLVGIDRTDGQVDDHRAHGQQDESDRTVTARERKTIEGRAATELCEEASCPPGALFTVQVDAEARATERRQVRTPVPL